MSIEVEQRGTPRLPGGRWVGIVVAAAVLIAIGVISLGGGTSSEDPIATVPAFADRPLNEQIPGFDGTVHVAITINREPTYVIWNAADREPQLIPLDTRNMVLSPDLGQLAGLAFVDPLFGDLRVGVPGGTRGVTFDVTAFAWHDTDPTRIAVSRTLNETSLWLADVVPNQNYVVFSGGNLEPGAVVVAFGDWGIALHSAPDSDGNITTILIDEGGGELLRLPGEVVASRPGPTGGVMVSDRRTGDVSVTWQGGADALYGVGDLLAVVWSNDLGAQAELRDGPEPGIDLLHVPLGDGEVRVYENLVPWAWDATGRFLAAADGRQLVVVDAEDGTVYELGIPRGLVSDVRFGA